MMGEGVGGGGGRRGRLTLEGMTKRNRETGTIWDQATSFKGSISNTSNKGN